jgi:hypothetical protein
MFRLTRSGSMPQRVFVVQEPGQALEAPGKPVRETFDSPLRDICLLAMGKETGCLTLTRGKELVWRNFVMT